MASACDESVEGNLRARLVLLRLVVHGLPSKRNISADGCEIGTTCEMKPPGQGGAAMPAVRETDCACTARARSALHSPQPRPGAGARRLERKGAVMRGASPGPRLPAAVAVA